MELTAGVLVGALGDGAADAAITIATEWEPIAGPGAPVKPAIYAGGRYQFGERWVPSGSGAQRVLTVSLDGVASQANRLERTLKHHRAVLGLPELVLDLSAVTTLPVHLPRQLSSFDFPHRNADAYLRDAMYDGKAFMQTPVGQEVFNATGDNPNGLLRWMPQAFLYGFWQSHLGKKRAQTKWARTWTSELFGIEPATDPTALVRTLGTKGDPLNLSVDSALQYDDNDTGGWSVAGDGRVGKKGGAGKSADALSNLGHGQVPFRESDSAPVGLSCRSIQQLSTVSFAGLRRLHTSASARALLVAIGLAAHRATFGRAVHLRSGCELRPTSVSWRWLGEIGATEMTVPSVEALVGLVAELAAVAAKDGAPVGPNWPADPVRLEPNAQLVKVITETWPLEPVE
jgi:CRISPR-associated protein Csb1